MLKKIKAIVGLAIIAALGGLFAFLSGVDFNTAFGPTYGTIAAAIVGYAVKESLPRLNEYIGRTFGTDV